MGTRKNKHQGKSAIGANGYFGSDGHGHCWGRGGLGSEGIGVGRVGVWGLGLEGLGSVG